MTWAERRKINLTNVAVIRATQTLAREGRIYSGMDHKLLVEAIALQWLTAEATVPAGDPEIDFDAIIAFIEALLPLLLRIIELIERLSK